MPSVTSDAAKEVWESFKRAGVRPTGRTVAKAIAQSGKYLPVSYRTINRWANCNSTPRRGSAKLHPMREAAKEFEAAVPVITGDPLTRVSDLAGKPQPIDVESLRNEIESLSDDGLIKRAARELYMTLILVMKHLQLNLHLVETMPGEVGTLMKASAGALYKATNGFKTLLDITDRVRKTVPNGEQRPICDFGSNLAVFKNKSETH